jgi:hypothetical protein
MSIVNRLINNPDSYSLDMLQRGVQNGIIPPYIGIPLIQQKMQEKQESQAMQQGPMNDMPSVAEQVMSQVSQDQGIDNLPSNLPAEYAGGGIVSFARGGTSSLAKMLLEDEDDDDYLSAVQSAMDQIEAMRGSAMGSAPVSYKTSSAAAPALMARESKEGVSVKLGNEPPKTVERQTKEVSKPANLEDLLALVQQKESGGQRYSRTGEVLTSPKGAMGEMQVMPGTALDPGFGIRPAKPGDLDDLARVGREYYARMLDKYGDPKIAAVAYNWGPGNTDKWLSAGADPAKLPQETRKYIQGFAEGGITSIQRFDVGGLTASQMMNLSMEDLTRMVRMSEPGAAEELARRRANYTAGRAVSDIGPARMSGTPAMELRNPTVTGGTPPAASAGIPRPSILSGLGRMLGMGALGYGAGELGASLELSQPTQTLTTADYLTMTPEEYKAVAEASTNVPVGTARAIDKARQGPPPVAPTPNVPRMTRAQPEKQTYQRGAAPAQADVDEYRRKRLAELAATYDREDLMAGQAGQALAQAKAAEAAAKPAAPAESDGMSALRKYIQEGMAEAKNQKEIDKYMALLQAGFGMLGGTSRIAAENIGRGAILGSQAYQEAAKVRSADQKSLLAAQLGLERSEQLGKLREAQLEAGTLGKQERDRLQAADIASRMEKDWMGRAEQTARVTLSKDPRISMDEAKFNAALQEARALARDKLNRHEPYRRLLMKAYEGYDPGQIDVGPEMEQRIAKFLQPKK